MGTRFEKLAQPHNANESEYRLMEVLMVKRGAGGKDVNSTQVVMVDNNWDTLRFVQENMDGFVTNIMKVKKMDELDRKRIDESARLFEKNLKPLFSLISRTEHRNVMAKLSVSLKKALLLMAMERYAGDEERMCRALGISRDVLVQEMNLCGLEVRMKAA